MEFVTDTKNAHLGGNIFEGDPCTYCPTVWEYTLKRFSITSVLDLGCGLGYSSSFFHSSDCIVLAVDGLNFNIENSVFPSLQIDLTKNAVKCKVDLVHCHEVVEHIEEKYLDNLLDSLMCGKFILMTNALPGQGGYHHVNEQPTQYWINHLVRRGCEVLVYDTKKVRRLAALDGAVFMANTGLLLVNRNR